MKTEYRAAYLDSKRLNERFDGTNAAGRLRHHLQALRADHQHLAGLPLQLGWRSDLRQVLISAKFSSSKAPASSGLFCAWREPRHGISGPRAQVNVRSAAHNSPSINPAMTYALAEQTGIVFDPELWTTDGNVFQRRPSSRAASRTESGTEGNPWPDRFRSSAFWRLPIGLLVDRSGHRRDAWPSLELHDQSTAVGRIWRGARRCRPHPDLAR